MTQVIQFSEPERKKIAKRYELSKQSLDALSHIQYTPEFNKLIASLLYWGSGSGKESDPVRFTTSDPDLVATFLTYLRRSFSLDESKFRALMYLHEYHHADREIVFWSSVTGIEPELFTKSHVAHSVKRHREGYHGCIRVTYHDTSVAAELCAWYNTFAHMG